MGDEGTTLWNDTQCKVEVAKEGEQLTLSAGRGLEKVGDKEAYAIELLGRKRCLKQVRIERDSQKLEGSGRPLSFLF